MKRHLLIHVKEKQTEQEYNRNGCGKQFKRKHFYFNHISQCSQLGQKKWKAKKQNNIVDNDHCEDNEDDNDDDNEECELRDF